MAQLKGGTTVAGSLTITGPVTADSFVTADGFSRALVDATLVTGDTLPKFDAVDNDRLVDSVISETGTTVTVTGRNLDVESGTVRGTGVLLQNTGSGTNDLTIENDSGLQTTSTTLSINTGILNRSIIFTGSESITFGAMNVPDAVVVLNSGASATAATLQAAIPFSAAATANTIVSRDGTNTTALNTLNVSTMDASVRANLPAVAPGSPVAGDIWIA